MSAWPQWRFISASMWTSTRCRVTGLRSAGHQADDVVARFRRQDEEVGVGVGALVEPGQGFGKGTAEGVAEVPGGDADEVFDDAEQIRRGGRHGAADVVLVEAVELPEQRVTRDAQVPVQGGLVIVVGHGCR
jgi:hypothetical protein